MKSFYYLVEWSDATRLREALARVDIPFAIEQIDEQLAFVFPDLPVRQFGFVCQLFGGVGNVYPN